MLSLSGVQKVGNFRENTEKPLNDEAYIVEKGEFISVIGNPSTVKLMIMNNLGLLDKANSFNVFSNEARGYNIARKSISTNKRINIGVAKKTSRLLLHLSALENVMFPMAYHKTRYNLKDRAVTLLNIVGLGSKMDFRPYQLTTEEQIRTTIAQALIDSPEYLIIDDLFEKIEDDVLENILKLLKEINDKGQTIIVINPSLEEASKIGKVVYLKDFEFENNIKMSFKV